MKKKLEALKETFNQKTFGVEIECFSYKNQDFIAQALREAGIEAKAETYNHENRTWWKVIHDGSINPNNSRQTEIEIVSPILKGNEGLEEVRKVCEIINTSEIKCEVNSSCGLHVHHGASDYKKQDFKNLYNLYNYYETEFDKFVPKSRRENNNWNVSGTENYCRSLKDYDFEDYYNERDAYVDHLGRVHNWQATRYLKLNFCSFVKYGTVEFRHFGGTTDADKICGWIVLTQIAVARAKEAKCIKKSKNNKLFWALNIYKTDAYKRTHLAREEQDRIVPIFKQLRSWTKVRAEQVA